MVSLASTFPEDAFVVGCPTRVVLDHVMSKWAPLLIAALSDGRPLRWSELRRRAEGISEKMLAQTLRTLEQDGLVHRQALAVVPPHVEYRLTPLGEELADRLVPLLAWMAAKASEILDSQPLTSSTDP
jgi:DNA-binding HxlR family transcriptional regulator